MSARWSLRGSVRERSMSSWVTKHVSCVCMRATSVFSSMHAPLTSLVSTTKARGVHSHRLPEVHKSFLYLYFCCFVSFFMLYVFACFIAFLPGVHKRGQWTIGHSVETWLLAKVLPKRAHDTETSCERKPSWEATRFGGTSAKLCSVKHHTGINNYQQLIKRNVMLQRT